MVTGCEHRPERKPESIEVQGHRGARGLWPENTLGGFLKAAALGVDVLELDCVLTADGVPVVHHDLYLNPDITRRDGRWLQKPEAALKTMPLVQVQEVDVGAIHPGSEYAQRFPSQAAGHEKIPTLREVLRATKEKWPQLRYNIELKIDARDREGSADPRTLASAVISVVQEEGLAERVTIQSFLFEALEIAGKLAPNIGRACLTSENRSYDTVLRGQRSPWTGRNVLSFGGHTPRIVHDAGCSIWSPAHRDVTSQDLQEAHRLGLQVIVWTVNRPVDIDRVITLGVDGIISDYPDRVLKRLGRR